jgi:hypothetical protein
MIVQKYLTQGEYQAQHIEKLKVSKMKELNTVLTSTAIFGFTRELCLTRKMKMNQQFSVTDKRLK